MKSFKLIVLICLLGYADLQAQVYEWAKRIDNKNVTIVSSGTTSTGDLVFTGTFRGTVDFDPNGGITNLVNSSSTTDDIFIVKYKNDGTFSWAKKIGGSSTDQVYDLVIDKDNGVTICGKIYGQVDMNPSSTTNNLGSSSNYTSYIARYTSTGSYSWAKGFSDKIEIKHLGVDNDRKVTASGVFTGSVDFNPSTSSTNNLTSVSSSKDIFLAQYSSTGSYNWANAYGNSNTTEKVYDLLVQSNGTIFVTGSFSGTIDFDPSSSSANLSATSDLFFARYTPAGAYNAAKVLSGSGEVNNAFLAIGSIYNHLYIGGTFSGTIDFDPSSSTYNLSSSSGNKDVFFVKYTVATTSGSSLPNYNFGFVKKVGDTSNDEVLSGFYTDASNILTFYGTFSGYMDLANSNINNLSSSGKDLFILKYDAQDEWSFVGGYRIGNNNNELANSLAYDKANSAFYILGEYKQPINMKAFSSGAPIILTGTSDKNNFITRYDDYFVSLYQSSALIGSETQEQNTGLNFDLGLSEVIILSPNPASKQLYISSTLKIESSAIRVFNMLGEEMIELRNTMNSNTLALNVESLKSGLYILHLEQNGQIYQEKFIKE